MNKAKVRRYRLRSRNRREKRSKKLFLNCVIKALSFRRSQITSTSDHVLEAFDNNFKHPAMKSFSTLFVE